MLSFTRFWIVVCVLLTAACGRVNETPEDTLVIGQVAEPRTLDPHVATSTNDFRILANIYEGLVRFADGSLEIEPALAHSWTVSEEATVYSFELREDVFFHDGSAFDAEAVRFNFERMLDPEHPFRHTGPFPLAFFFEAVEKIETPDPYTVVFHLSEPFSPFLANLAYPTGYLVSPESVRNKDNAFGRNPVGTGPFRFVDWVSRRRVLLERNPDYYAEPAAIKQLLFRPLADENARLTEMLAGSVDLIMEVPPDIVEFFRSAAEFKVIERAGPHLWFCILNTREGPFADPRMRRAVNLAVDRKSITRDLLQGTASAAYSFFPDAFGIYGEGKHPEFWRQRDLDKARALIDDAGYAGATIRFLVTDSGSGMLEPRAMAEAIQADLARVGLNLRIETFEWNTYLSIVNGGLQGHGDMAQMAWMTNDPDTLPYLTLRRAAWPEDGGFNSGYFANEALDELLEEARRTAAPEQRNRLYREADRILHETAPWIPVASWRQNAVLSRSVEGLELQPSFLLKLERARK
ncbi:MAG: ABC transporter substrate-binding protein [Opitutales bacterium]|nr:ABC transporter substrate-binding protein [Opitutales bacterium]